MAQYPCKLLTDECECYAVYCSVVGLFISRAYDSAAEAMRAGGFSPVTNFQDLAENVIDLRLTALERAFALIAKLKEGNPLTDDEAFELWHFAKFLSGTVGGRKNGIPRKSLQKMWNWVRSLNLGDGKGIRALKHILDDPVLYPAYHMGFWNKLNSKPDLQDLQHINEVRSKTTPNHYKMAGLYLEELALISGITGKNKRTVFQIFETHDNDLDKE
jgi:hypothetical protein